MDPNDPLLDRALMAFLREVAIGRDKFDEPSVDYNPLTLSPVGSVRVGLPPPPLRSDPAFDLWLNLAWSRVRRGATPTVELVDDVPRTGYNRAGAKGHMETSRNWSGAVIAAPYRERPFGLIIGSWNVPGVRVPPGKRGTDYACSTWIGFDGHRRLSKSLPQIGTVQEIINGKTSIKAWWQWWWPNTDGPHDYDPIAFPIAPGDRMIASLFVVPKIGVLFNMMNFTTGQPVEPRLRPPPDPGLTVMALDAECILERPKPFNQPEKNFVVPDFDPTTFRCHSFLRGQTEGRDMRGGRVLRMIHQGWDRQIETIAAPLREPDLGLVTMRYCGV